MLGAGLLPHLPVHTQLQLQLLQVHTSLHGRVSSSEPHTAGQVGVGPEAALHIKLAPGIQGISVGAGIFRSCCGLMMFRTVPCCPVKGEQLCKGKLSLRRCAYQGKGVPQWAGALEALAQCPGVTLALQFSLNRGQGTTKQGLRAYS